MQRITPYIDYENVPAAIDWLSKAFGFREVLRWTDEDGRVGHAEITLGPDANVMLGGPAGYRDPIGTTQYQVLSCQVDDVDAHFERAKAAGATIERVPTDEPYGIRTYRCLDPFGRAWWFYTAIRQVEPEEWGAVRAPDG